MENNKITKNKTQHKIIKYIIKHTLTYKIFITLKSFYYYINDKSIIGDTFYSPSFKYILKQYLNVDFRKDWLGRLYGVINPNIDINGNINFNNSIIEIDDENTNNNKYVIYWVYKQMNLVRTVFKLENSPFFDYIGAEFRHVGPINQDNYLVIFDIISRKIFINNFKPMLLQLFIYIILIVGGCFLFF